MKADKQADTKKIARCFLKAAETYDKHAVIQNLVSRRLVERLGDYSRLSFDNVLEIGCCTGGLTEMLLQKHPIQKLYLNDLVLEFEEAVRLRVTDLPHGEIIPLFGDIEQIELPTGLDLVLSSATFQWLGNLQALFAKITSSLNGDGFLAFTIFGPGTLYEFKEVTGIGLEYAAVGKLLDMLEKHFYIEEERTLKDQLFFHTPREILRHLQATGVGGVEEFRWTPAGLRHFEKKYSREFGEDRGVPVTYVSSSIIASRKT